MLNIPEEIKALYRRPNSSRGTWRTLKMRFYDKDIHFLYPDETLFPSDGLFPVDEPPICTIDGTQVPDDNLTLTQTLCTGQSIAFGTCGSAMVEVTVTDVRMDLSGKWFTLSLEAGGYEMMLGIFKVRSFERQADRTKKAIVAYDRMLNFEADVSGWYRGLDFPMTLKQFRDSLCGYVGVEQRQTVLPLDDMQVTRGIDPSSLSGRDVLKSICEINGCFGQIEVSGKLKYVFLGNSGLYPSEELYPSEGLYPREMEGETLSHHKDATYEDYLVESIDRVQIRQEEGDIGAGYGEGPNTYTIQGNFLMYGKGTEELERVAAITHKQISGKVYRPCQITTAGLPWIEPGDGIICYTTDDVIETYCLRRTMRGIQATMDTYEAQGTRVRDDKCGSKAMFVQMEGKSAVIKRSVEEVSVRVTDLKKFTEAQLAITAEQILAEVTRAQEAEAALRIQADKITLDVKDFKEDTASKFEQTADQIALKVSKGDVSSQLSVEPGAINLTTNRLSWKSDFSSMTQDGTLTCRNLKAINGYFSGILNSTYMGGDGNGAYLGDYSVSADGSNKLKSSNGFVVIDCKARPAGSPGGDYALLKIGGDGYVGVEMDGLGNITGGDVKARSCNLAHGSSRLWGLGETIDWFWDKFVELRERVDNLS